MALLLVGVLGIVFMLLVFLGIIPVSLSKNIRVVTYVVMGGMFVIFIIVGIRSFIFAKKYMDYSVEEDKLNEDIRKWFSENFDADTIDKAVFFSEDVERNKEMDYFKRFDYMKSLINDHFDNPDSAMVEDIADSLYTEIYEH